jgi:hypothetical protein
MRRSSPSADRTDGLYKRLSPDRLLIGPASIDTIVFLQASGQTITLQTSVDEPFGGGTLTSTRPRRHHRR